jgi:hypothetical protein
MRVYEVVTRGIPEADGISHGVFKTKEKAETELNRLDREFEEEDPSYGYDYSLTIIEKTIED